MKTGARNRLLLFGGLWGLLLAVVPAALAFDGFAFSPFLVSALVCAALSGGIGALVAGRRAARNAPPGRRGLLAVSGIGALGGLVSAALAALTIWLSLGITITSGSSIESPAGVLGPFVQSAVAALAIFAYATILGLLFAPLVGATVVALAREGYRRPSAIRDPR